VAPRCAVAVSTWRTSNRARRTAPPTTAPRRHLPASAYYLQLPPGSTPRTTTCTAMPWQPATEEPPGAHSCAGHSQTDRLHLRWALPSAVQPLSTSVRHATYSWILACTPRDHARPFDGTFIRYGETPSAVFLPGFDASTSVVLPVLGILSNRGGTGAGSSVVAAVSAGGPSRDKHTALGLADIANIAVWATFKLPHTAFPRTPVRPHCGPAAAHTGRCVPRTLTPTGFHCFRTSCPHHSLFSPKLHATHPPHHTTLRTWVPAFACLHPHPTLCPTTATHAPPTTTLCTRCLPGPIPCITRHLLHLTPPMRMTLLHFPPPCPSKGLLYYAAYTCPACTPGDFTIKEKAFCANSAARTPHHLRRTCGVYTSPAFAMVERGSLCIGIARNGMAAFGMVAHAV